jgi:tetratricopeptide (TPR) repeat protein
MLITQAQTLQDGGKNEEALERYSQAFDVLIDNAGKYAREQESDITDMQELRANVDRLFAHSTVFLKQNITAAYILNAMGVLFAELKDYENAQQKFTEAMVYIPTNIEYSDPADNLERIAAEVAAMRE